MTPPLLRVADTTPGLVDTLGPGRRAVVWVQGCSLGCRGCIVPESWDPAARGTDVEPRALARSLLEADPDTHLTVSGGEPTDQSAAVAELLAEAHSLGRTTWVYTGHTLEELVSEARPEVLELLAHTDVLVDGRFEIRQAGAYVFRGSGNQRIIRLTDAISRNAALSGTPGKVELELDADGELVLMGIPVPGFMEQLEANMRAKGLTVRRAGAGRRTRQSLDNEPTLGW